MKIYFYTLGCKVNQFETQALSLLLSEHGHEVCESPENADVIVINTCTVTAESDRKSRSAIRRFAKNYPGAKIAVCGCLSQINPESIRNIEGVSVIAGTAARDVFVENICNITNVNNHSFTPDNSLRRREFEYLPAGGLHGHTRAMLKIEDGCTNFCTYCIIPYSRGPVRSLAPDIAVAECRKLHAQNYKEIVLTGIEISSYGKDLVPKSELSVLVAQLCNEFPDIRFRLGSIEPRTITKEFCEKLSSFTNLCPHFHLSMQSGCDETLSRMHRKYNTERFYLSVSLLREYFPGCAITTDMIVGFPGETEDEFETTLAFIEKCEFSSMHIFPYSKRAGTPAAKMENQITKAEKTERARRASAVAKRMEIEYLKSLIGSVQSVLFEEPCDGYFVGHAKNYVRVYVKCTDDMKNNIKNVKICDLYLDGLLGEIL